MSPRESSDQANLGLMRQSQLQGHIFIDHILQQSICISSSLFLSQIPPPLSISTYLFTALAVSQGL